MLCNDTAGQTNRGGPVHLWGVAGQWGGRGLGGRRDGRQGGRGVAQEEQQDTENRALHRDGDEGVPGGPPWP